VNDSATLHAGPDIDATAVIDGLTVQSSAGSAFLATDARPRVLGCTFISATSRERASSRRIAHRLWPLHVSITRE
jgi:hypothetical protein